MKLSLIAINLTFIISLFIRELSSHNIKLVDTVSLDFLNKFNNFDVFVHFDKTSCCFNGAHIFLNRILAVKNYDNLVYMTRPRQHKFVHLVFLNNLRKFEEFTKIPYNIKKLDIIIFMDVKNDSFTFDEHLFGLNNIQSSSLIIYFKISKNILYYKNSFLREPVKNITLADFMQNSTLINEAWKSFEQLNGHTFKIAYANCPPYINGIYVNGEYILNGIEAKILQTIGKKMNFKYVASRFYNMAQENKNIWKILIETVHNRTMDIAIGCITITYNRIRIVDFPEYISYASYRAMFYKSSTGINPSAIIDPFDFVSWIVTLLCTSIVAFVLIISNLYVKKTAGNYDIFDDIKLSVSCLIEQSVSNIFLKIFSTYLLLTVWKLSTIILTNTYKSKLASTMIRPVLNDANSIQDLITKNYIIQINTDDSILESYLNTFYSPTIKKTFESTSYCKAIINMLQKPSYALIADEKCVYYDLKQSCIAKIGKAKVSNLRILNNKFFSNQFGWAMVQGAPYKRAFTNIIVKLREAGLMDRWYEEYNIVITRSNSRTNKDSEPRTLQIQGILGHIYILIIGYILGFCSFIIELCFHKKI